MMHEPSTMSPQETGPEPPPTASVASKQMRTIVADDNSTPQASEIVDALSSQPSQSITKIPVIRRSARARTRNNTLTKRRNIPTLNEDDIISWAEMQSRSHPDAVIRVSQEIRALVPLQTASIGIQVEGIDWDVVKQEVTKQMSVTQPESHLTDKMIHKRFQGFVNPECSPRSVVTKVLHDDDNESVPEAHSLETPLESLTVEEPSPFLTSEIDSDLERQLSQDLNTVKVPVSIPLKTRVEPPPLAPEPVQGDADLVPIIPSPKTASIISCPQAEPTHGADKAPMKGSPSKMSGRPRTNTLLQRWQQHRSMLQKAQPSRDSS